MGQITYITYYGIAVGVISNNPPTVQANRDRHTLCSVIGYLVAWEHIIRKDVTDNLVSLCIKDKTLSVIWKKQIDTITKYMVDEAWRSPIGLHGPVEHSVLELANDKPKHKTPEAS